MSLCNFITEELILQHALVQFVTFYLLSVRWRGKVTAVTMAMMWSTSGGAVLRIHPSTPETSADHSV